MNKILAAFMALMVFTGCSMNDAQKNVVANNAGMMAAVAWIAYDNPSSEALGEAYEVLNVIENALVAITATNTYLQVIYPVVEEAVNTGDIEPQYKPLVLASAVAVLNGLDIFATLNPEWMSDQEDAIALAQKFINGARVGFGMSDSDPLIKQARAFTEARAKVFQE